MEIELQVTPEQSRMLQRTQEQLRLIRNTVLSELKTRYDQMVRTKAHKKIMTHLHKIHSKLECTINEEKIVALKTDQKLLNEALEALREAHQVTFNDGRLYAEMLHDTKFSLPDAVTVWTASEMAWQSIEGLLFHHAERVYFYKHDDLMTLQGKQADRSIIVKCDKTRDMWFVSHHGMTFPVIVKPHDLFIEETLSHVQYYWEHGGAMDQQNYSGPRKLDNLGGLQVLHWIHHAKTKTSHGHIQGAGDLGDAQRGANRRANRCHLQHPSRTTASMEASSPRQFPALIHRIASDLATSSSPRRTIDRALCRNRQTEHAARVAQKKIWSRPSHALSA